MIESEAMKFIESAIGIAEQRGAPCCGSVLASFLHVPFSRFHLHRVAPASVGYGTAAAAPRPISLAILVCASLLPSPSFRTSPALSLIRILPSCNAPASLLALPYPTPAKDCVSAHPILPCASCPWPGAWRIHPDADADADFSLWSVDLADHKFAVVRIFRAYLSWTGV